MTQNTDSGNDPQDYNTWVLIRVMNGVLSIDDYDELRDFG